jgi:hypothetical protein
MRLCVYFSFIIMQFKLRLLAFQVTSCINLSCSFILSCIAILQDKRFSALLNLLRVSSSSYRLLTRTTLALCANIHCAQFDTVHRYSTCIFVLCMHHVKFNILLRAQISVHTTEYTAAKQLIFILMRVTTKLPCVKQYLCTPCAPYYVCAYRARLISVRASTHNNLPRGATIYRAHWHATVSRAVLNLPRTPVRQPFPRTLYDSNSGHFEVTFL